ncbi:MAG: molybdenum ABC transporter ATP-binding protein [Gammaproteobacteria bacterium]
MTIEARYRVERGEFRLDAEFSIPSRGITALFGPSGAGKTTLLRAIAGLDSAVSGYLQVGDETWQNEDTSLATHERALGFVFQDANLFPHLSVQRNLRFGFDRVPASERKIALDDAVAWLGIRPLLDREPDQLSGGERQRVAIARALVTSPRLLLLDEPLASLDAAGKADILPYLESLHAELDMPVIYVSHAADEVARLADHMILMERGRVLACGPIAELLTRFDLPLALSADAESVVDATVAAHDDEYSLTYVDFSGGRFSVARKDLPVGRDVRLRILARDVSLTLQRQADTSILNVFPAVVEATTNDDKSRTVVRLRVGDASILAQVTRKSAAALDISQGRELFAQIKSVALLA